MNHEVTITIESSLEREAPRTSRIRVNLKELSKIAADYDYEEFNKTINETRDYIESSIMSFILEEMLYLFSDGRRINERNNH